jgi:AcrR family transcriptional regulator
LFVLSSVVMPQPDVAASPPPTAASASAGPSGGKREQTKLQNRQAILEAAREVFGEMGYEAASVRDIIRRTPLSVGAFYNYFRSKDELCEALAGDGAARFQPILRAQREQARDFEGYVRGAIRGYFHYLADEHNNWQARRPPDEPVVHPRQDTPEMRAVFEEVRDSLVEVMARGEAPAVDPDYLAAACIALAREVGETMLKRRPLDVDGAADFVVRMILGGLTALPRLPTGSGDPSCPNSPLSAPH